jgi:hypothetical protein
MLALEDGSNMLSENCDNTLSTDAVQYSRRSSTSRPQLQGG